MTTAAEIVAAYPKAGLGLAHAIVGLSVQMGWDPAWIANVLEAESGFNPKAVNGESGATGILQWIPTTAQALGTSTAALYQMTAVQQFQYVEKYLRPFANRVRSQSDLALAVFYPKYLGKPDSYRFPKKVRADNETIATVGDLVRQVLKKSKLPFGGTGTPHQGLGPSGAALPPTSGAALVLAPDGAPPVPRKRPRPKPLRWTFAQKALLTGAAVMAAISISIVIGKATNRI